jgi:cytochrome c55X
VDFRAAALKRRFLIGLMLAAVAADGSAQAPPAAAASGVAVDVGASAASATPTPPAPTAEAGRKVYTSFCTRCHGIHLVVTGSAYYDLRTFPPGDKERFVRSVSKGLRAMPAWEGTVKPEQIEALWLYLGAVNGWPQ